MEPGWPKPLLQQAPGQGTRSEAAPEAGRHPAQTGAAHLQGSSQRPNTQQKGSSRPPALPRRPAHRTKPQEHSLSRAASPDISGSHKRGLVRPPRGAKSHFTGWLWPGPHRHLSLPTCCQQTAGPSSRPNSLQSSPSFSQSPSPSPQIPVPLPPARCRANPWALYVPHPPSLPQGTSSGPRASASIHTSLSLQSQHPPARLSLLTWPTARPNMALTRLLAPLRNHSSCTSHLGTGPATSPSPSAPTVHPPGCPITLNAAASQLSECGSLPPPHTLRARPSTQASRGSPAPLEQEPAPVATASQGLSTPIPSPLPNLLLTPVMQGLLLSLKYAKLVLCAA